MDKCAKKQQNAASEVRRNLSELHSMSQTQWDLWRLSVTHKEEKSCTSSTTNRTSIYRSWPSDIIPTFSCNFQDIPRAGIFPFLRQQGFLSTLWLPRFENLDEARPAGLPCQSSRGAWCCGHFSFKLPRPHSIKVA